LSHETWQDFSGSAGVCGHRDACPRSGLDPRLGRSLLWPRLSLGGGLLLSESAASLLLSAGLLRAAGSGGCRTKHRLYLRLRRRSSLALSHRLRELETALYYRSAVFFCALLSLSLSLRAGVARTHAVIANRLRR